MLTTLPNPIDESTIDALADEPRAVTGRIDAASLAGMSFRALQELQWQEEQAAAREIMRHPKSSPERAEAIRRAYDTICTILAAQSTGADQPLVMGLDPRYVQLVLKLL